jgi:hypothetical protein
LVSIGDGIDPRSDELREQSKAIAEAARANNPALAAEEVRFTCNMHTSNTSK